MRRLILVATAAAITLAAAPESFAQSRQAPDPECRTGQHGQQSDCTPDPRDNRKAQPRAEAPRGNQQARNEPQARPAEPAPSRPNTPRVGEPARNGQPFMRAGNSRFKAPPRGQEYRVVNEHLVLVDSQTLRIVTVLGLLRNLTN